MLHLLHLEEQSCHYWQKYLFANTYRRLLLNESLYNAVNSIENGKRYECAVLHVQDTTTLPTAVLAPVLRPTILRYAATSVALPALLTLHMSLWVSPLTDIPLKTKTLL